MNEANQQRTAQTPGQFRPSLALYHANGKGTGAAIKMTLHPAHDDIDGCIMLTMANQLTVGDRRGPNPVFPTFAWDGRLTVKLDFSDLTEMLTVFRGESESAGGGKGLFHTTAQFTTSINLRHVVEPGPCYSLELFRTSRDGRSESRARFILSPNEALGISLAVEQSMGVICFGIPMLVPHDTSKYRREAREVRNGAAAA